MWQGGVVREMNDDYTSRRQVIYIHYSVSVSTNANGKPYGSYDIALYYSITPPAAAPPFPSNVVVGPEVLHLEPHPPRVAEPLGRRVRAGQPPEDNALPVGECRRRRPPARPRGLLRLCRLRLRRRRRRHRRVGRLPLRRLERRLRRLQACLEPCGLQAEVIR